MRARASLSGFWFLYLGALGIFFPFYTLYLSENAGLSGSQVGLVVAMLQLVGICVQPIWGAVADRTGSRSRVLTALALCAAVGFALLGGAPGFPWLLAGTALVAAFHQAVIPMCMSVTLASLRHVGRYTFGVVRMFGTVGFLVMVVCFPLVLHRYQESAGLARLPGGPSEPGLEVMFYGIAALAALAACVALFVPRTGAVTVRAQRGDFRELLRHGPFLRFLAWSVGIYFCVQGPMSLFPILIRSLGGSLDDVSHMWIVMVSLEIPLIALSGAALARIGARGLLFVGAAMGALRWSVTGFASDLGWVQAVQILHGPIVAGLVIGGPLYVDSVVPERLRSTGQALLAMVGVGIGGMTSNLVGGWLIEHVSTRAPAMLGGLLAVLLAVALPFVLPRPTRPGEPPLLPGVRGAIATLNDPGGTR